MDPYADYYGSDGSSIATPTQNAKIAASESGWLSSLTSIVKTAIPAAATVYANAQATKAQANADLAAAKQPAPVIGQPYGMTGAPASNKNILFIGAGAVVFLLAAFMILKKK
jgi:hypothetical protein